MLYKSLITLEKEINKYLVNINDWLCTNKLSLNIDKSNFIIFHTVQKKKLSPVRLTLNNCDLKEETKIRYLGILFDSNLSWKQHISHLSRKIKRNIGAISKVRHYVNTIVLTNLYYSLVYPYFLYGIVIWGNTYSTTTKPISLLQKRAVRIITFSEFQDHTIPLFIKLKLLKFNDLVYLHTALLMFDFHAGKNINII